MVKTRLLLFLLFTVSVVLAQPPRLSTYSIQKNSSIRLDSTLAHVQPLPAASPSKPEETTGEFWKDKGTDFAISIIGTALGLLITLFFYRKQADDTKAAEARQLAAANETERRQVAAANEAERRQIAAANEAERRQIAEAYEAERRRDERTRAAEKLSIEQRRLDHVRWFNGIIKQVLDYAEQQATEMEIFVAKIQNDPSTTHQLALIASSSISRLTRADNEATFHAYNLLFSEEVNRDKSYRDFLKRTDFLAGSISKVIEDFNYYRKNTYDRELHIKALADASADTLATLTVSMEAGGNLANLFHSNLHQTCNNALLLFSKLKALKRPLKPIILEYVRPLATGLYSERQTLGVNGLIIKLSNISKAFGDLEEYSKQFIPTFSPSKLREPALQLKEFWVKLDSAIEVAQTSIDNRRNADEP